MLLLVIGMTSLSSVRVTAEENNCRTKPGTGPQPDQLCVIPFTYKGSKYNGCTNATDPDGKFWCATNVGPEGLYIPKSKAWGFCDAGCPLHDSFYPVPGEIQSFGDTGISSSSDSTLPETLRQCPFREVCIHNTKCPRYIGKSSRLTTLSRNSNSYLKLLRNIRRSVCNNQRRGVCCPGTSSAAKTKRPTRPRSLTSQTGRTKQSSPSYLPGKGSCGLNPDKPPDSIQIVGGNDTRPGQFPYTAIIGFPKKKICDDRRGVQHSSKVTSWGCGGTLINNWYVLTAAHCNTGAKISRVRLGEWRVEKLGKTQNTYSCFYSEESRKECHSGGCFPDPQDFIISDNQVHNHPGYTRSLTNIKNDIALIRLPRPAKLNALVQIACLPIDAGEAAKALNLDNIDEDLVGAWTTVVGWGYTDYDPYLGYNRSVTNTHSIPSATQQYLEVHVLSKEKCLQWWPRTDMESSQICAWRGKGYDSCRGDSGGPLYLTKVTRGTKKTRAGGLSPWYLMGLVSFGSKDCGVITGAPGFYTRIHSFIPWIKDQIENWK